MNPFFVSDQAVEISLKGLKTLPLNVGVPLAVELFTDDSYMLKGSQPLPGVQVGNNIQGSLRRGLFDTLTEVIKMASFYTLTEDQVEILREGLICHSARLMTCRRLTRKKMIEIEDIRKILDRE